MLGPDERLERRFDPLLDLDEGSWQLGTDDKVGEDIER